MSSFVPSTYQAAIFDVIKASTVNLMVEAVAGSGKSTTIKKALSFVPSMDQVLFLAFNKHIADALKKDVPRNVEVATLNSFGWRICRTAYQGAALEANKTMIHARAQGQVPGDWIGPMTRVISLLKAVNATHFYRESIMDVAERYDVDLPKEPAFFDLVTRTALASFNDTKMLDFDDQIYFPVAKNLPIPRYDLVMVDEAQDLSAVQVALVTRAAIRVIAVGDRAQAIYGFRGADPEAMPRMAKQLEMKLLPLSICYRCPKGHVELAKAIVPQIEAAPTAASGSVTTIEAQSLAGLVKAGDYILCRTTAPLVQTCLSLLAAGISAVVKGRDFGQGLIDFCGRIRKKCADGDIEAFMSALAMYMATELARLRAADRDTQPLEDRYETIMVLSEGCTSSDELPAKISSLFSDVPSSLMSVILCSVHRSKGLECDNVFIIRPDLLPFPKAKKPWQRTQEMNLKYVALTRARKSLTFVEG